MTRAVVAAVVLSLAACNAQLVFDPEQPLQPNFTDSTSPDLEVRVFFDATRFDAAIKPTGAVFFAPLRCFHVPSPLRVMVIGTDLEGGISHLSVGSVDLVPLASTIVVSPAPDFTTQTDDPASPNVTFPNPGMSPGSHTAEVTYFSGANPPGRPRGHASLSVHFNMGTASVATLIARARNTSASASTSTMDGYFVRPADASHPAGTACTPPP